MPTERLAVRSRIWRALPDWLVAIRRYQKTHGTLPNLVRPTTFNEKILHRILFDRRAVLTHLTDKAAVRAFVEARLGPQLLPRLYHLTTRPETIPFDELPDRFVVKPTHGSGWISIVTDKASLDRAALVRTCTSWLTRNYYETGREWAYKHIEPRLIVEEFIDDGTGAPPNDYKVFVFGGRVECIQVDAGRFTDHRRRLYTPAWKKLDVLFGYADIGVDMPPPPHLGETIAAAEALGRDLDFVRADFFDTAERLYFGELTLTPECGLVPFRPEQFDRYLGGRWTLPGRMRP